MPLIAFLVSVNRLFWQFRFWPESVEALRQRLCSQNYESPVVWDVPIDYDLPFLILTGQMTPRVMAEELDKLQQYHKFMVEPHTVPQTKAPKLVFSNRSLGKIYTEHKVLDCNGNPLELKFEVGDQIMPILHDRTVTAKLCVLNGDFPEDTWTSKEFDDNIVKQRENQRSLLVGNLHVMLKHGMAIIEDIKFTDNSSWTRSKTFKIGAKVVATGINDDLSGVVLEAVTEAFRVTERRMKLMAKHYPPNLDDEVWRLEKIMKGGAFHKRLQEAKIYTVKDILNLSATPDGEGKLRGILARMPEQWWEAMLQHAMTCKTEGSRSFWEKTLAQLAVTNSIIKYKLLVLLLLLVLASRYWNF